jgi:hypothetical protein
MNYEAKFAGVDNAVCEIKMIEVSASDIRSFEPVICLFATYFTLQQANHTVGWTSSRSQLSPVYMCSLSSTVSCE